MEAVNVFLAWSVLILLGNLEPLIVAKLVLVNKGINTERGQITYVTENELQFNTSKERNSCKVEVVINEPATQRVGKLTPQVFDCHFLPNEVRYIHNGCPLLKEDTVILRVYRFTSLETIVETFVIYVKIRNSSSSLVEFGHIPLEVPHFFGLSQPIDRSILSFRYNGFAKICTVRIVSSESQFPAVGQLIAEDPKTQQSEDEQVPIKLNKGSKEIHDLKISCEEFLEMGLRYQHISPPSPDKDYISIQVEIIDKKSRFQQQAENVWIPVKIKGAIPNVKPQAAFMAMFILEIDEFILTPLTTVILDAIDEETQKQRLVFNITKPPPLGYITHLEDQSKAIRSFTWQDLYDTKVAFQPSNISHSERQNYEVEFQAIDSFFMNSLPISVHFSVRNAVMDAPRVAWNMGLDLLEGQSRPITWQSLQIVDNDNLHSVQLLVVEGLNHGWLTVQGKKGFKFGVKELRNGVVRYHHDDSDTTKDDIVFRIYDGKHSVRHKFPINILPKDDSPPFLVNNLVLELEEGDCALIENHILMAADFDSNDDYILYKISKPPSAGELIKQQLPDGSGTSVSSFFQRDLFRGLIYYHHFGDEVFQDSFEFILADSQEPPNLSDPQNVMIHIMPVKDHLPEAVPGTIRHLVVKETEIALITKNHLHFTDAESPDNQILYTVTKACFSPTSPGLYDAGRLIFTDNVKKYMKNSPPHVLSSFTQHAISHLKVAYMPPFVEMGPDLLFVQFEFSVSDQQGGMRTGLIFNITVMPVDDEAPEIFTNQLKTAEGGHSFITAEHLMVTDLDTKTSDIKIELKKSPLHGHIKLHGDIMLEGEKFTLWDLHSSNVWYQHDSTETLEDRVMFLATDGFNTADGMLIIQITPVNDEPPELQPGLKSSLECPEGEQILITAEYLYATDVDNDDVRLTYMIVKTPKHGVIQKDNFVVNRFSQHDVTQGAISYVHTGGEIGHEYIVDSITFVISDGETGIGDGCCIDKKFPLPIPLHPSLPVHDLNVTILPINNQEPSIQTGEILIVEEGASTPISLKYLDVKDEDSKPEELTFFLETNPVHGYLENILPTPGYEKTNVGLNISVFTFQNLQDGYINYVQSKHENLEPISDGFMVSVSDGLHKSIAMPFYIVIVPVNDETPQLKLRNITVMEGNIVAMGPDTINVEDFDIPQDPLRFYIVTPPWHGLILNGTYGREIEHYRKLSPVILHQDLEIHSFTLEELKKGLMLMYMHDDTESLEDSFTVQLTDGKHTVQGTLYIYIMPVNDEIPHLSRNTGLEVEVGGSKVISSVSLEVEDKDSPRNQLQYVINNKPKWGHLKLKTASAWSTLHPGMNFTQDDVDMNRLWYFHTNILTPESHDSFRFYVTDGQNSSPPGSFYMFIKSMEKATDKVNRGVLVNGQLRDDPIEFMIQVECQDKMVPKLVVKASPSTIQNLKDGRLAVPITVHNLKVTDDDSRDEDLIFTVRRQPYFGYLEHSRAGGLLKSSFTQDDLNHHNIRYIINPITEVTSDSFTFEVSDSAGNTIVPENLEVKWSRIELEETCYRICENTGSLPIKIIRHGENAEPLFVGIKVQDGSARNGLDFKHSTARLIQFDPGVSTKIWNIFLQDDGLEENNEVFKVILNKPKNAVLGHKREATIEILDSSSGGCLSSVTYKNGRTLKMLERTSNILKGPLHAGHSCIPTRRGTGVQDKQHLDKENPHPSSLPRRHVPQLDPYQGITPSGEEVSSSLHSENHTTARESFSDLSFHLQSQQDHPQEDLDVKSKPIPLQTNTKQRTKSRKCPSSWTLRDKYCYILSSTSNATWESAEKACRKWSNGHLTSVHSPNEMAWLWNFANKQSFWIGLKEDKMGSWVWSNNRPVTFHHFKHGKARPRTTNEQRCAFVQMEKKWATRICRQRLNGRFVCSIPSVASNNKF
ncbi:FRAS1-related extracellular matrix protein 1 isoform X3 [Anolis carolinensis]|uniref:FRAS1-related extracellular matrix protein 1 isoform X3 n=1 Tax=Anolis carolinensis TaxID=28377 RepID=UPI002F2B799F